MLTRHSLAAPCAALVLFASPAPAQSYTILDGNVRFTVTPPADITSSHCDFTASSLPCSTDNLWGTSWIYAIAGQGIGTQLTDAGHGGYITSGDGTRTFTQAIRHVDGNFGLHVDTVDTATSTGPESGRIDHSITFRNQTGATVSIRLYRYIDVDLNANIADDSATGGIDPVTGIGRLVLTDSESCTSCLELAGLDAVAHYTASTYRGSTFTLPTAGVDLDDAGLPFGPSDFTGCLQWNLTIADGATTTVRAVMGHADVHAGVGAAATILGFGAGTAGGPQITANAPRLGAGDLTIAIQNGGSAARADLLFAFDPNPVQIPYCGLGLLASPVVATAQVALTAGAGAITIGLGACSPRAAGLPLVTQAFVIDLGGPCAALPLGHSPLLLTVPGD